MAKATIIEQAHTVTLKLTKTEADVIATLIGDIRWDEQPQDIGIPLFQGIADALADVGANQFAFDPVRSTD